MITDCTRCKRALTVKDVTAKRSHCGACNRHFTNLGSVARQKRISEGVRRVSANQNYTSALLPQAEGIR